MYEFSTSGLFRRILRVLYWAAHLPLLLAVLWVIGLAFCQPLCALPVIPFVAIVIWRLRQQWGATFSVRRWVTAFCACEAAMFYCLPGPDTDHWEIQTARIPVLSKSADGMLHITNIRDFAYRSETAFDVRYLEEDFNTRELCGAYLIDSINAEGNCDLMLSFAFTDGRYLVIAPEMRIPAGTPRNNIRAHYKNYGLIYTFGTEEDLLLSRTNIFKEHLHLYPLKADAEQCRLMLQRCVRLAQEAAADNSAYNPIHQHYANDLLTVLHIICPAMSESGLSNEEAAAFLYTHHALDTTARGDWSAVQRTFAAGYNIISETRETYSDALRRRLGMTVRAAVPERQLQEQMMQPARRQATRRSTSSDLSLPPAKPTSIADIPEPGERLANDHRSFADMPEFDFPDQRDPKTRRRALLDIDDPVPDDLPDADKPEDTDAPAETPAKPEEDEAAAATRELDKAPSLLPRKPSLADAIPEPGARLREDARKAEEEEEAAAAAAASGPRDVDSIIFGRKPKADPQADREAADEYDPFAKPKKKNPFEEEKPKKKAEGEEDDPFKPKEPIRI